MEERGHHLFDLEDTRGIALEPERWDGEVVLVEFLQRPHRECVFRGWAPECTLRYTYAFHDTVFDVGGRTYTHHLVLEEEPRRDEDRPPLARCVYWEQESRHGLGTKHVRVLARLEVIVVSKGEVLTVLHIL